MIELVAQNFFSGLSFNNIRVSDKDRQKRDGKWNCQYEEYSHIQGEYCPETHDGSCSLEDGIDERSHNRTLGKYQQRAHQNNCDNKRG